LFSAPNGADGAFTITRILGTPAGNLTGAQDALMTEAIACWKAFETAAAHGISRLHLETDSALYCRRMQFSPRGWNKPRQE